ncbi:MAG TPA: ribonuclease P protein component [Candidatus Kapabacteria bacterium]|jgi:ribonuclease P protein component|nr:ribonuclease P protein component [Candidatus Kapabacteria bacterium]HOM04653.1 ribonuclease P protein component [Candidatus Kapabacteria bacterium]HPP39191.1 ribonuclease P protein component [Candidatus Kapabacteria bacterium]HPU23299.1 ribonuclease P protein component [Candidatus Kapabacteria bacterium]
MPCSRLATIKKQKRFQEVFANGKKFSTSNLFVVIECNEAATTTIEYAVVASKKVSKRAVVRNRVKRLLREVLRQYVHLLLVGSAPVSAIILFWRTPVAKPSLIRLTDVFAEFMIIVEKFRNSCIKRQVDEENPDNID